MRPLTRLLPFFALAACAAEPPAKGPTPAASSASARTAPPASSSAPPPVTGRGGDACFEAARAGQEIRSFRRDGARVVLCLGDDERTGPVACLGFDPTASAFSRAVEPKAPASEAPAFSAVTRGEELHVCARGEAPPCKRSIRPGFSPVRGDQKAYAAAVSPDGGRVFVLRHVLGKGSHEVFGDLHDVAKKKRLSSTSVFAPARPGLFGDLGDVWSAEFVGRRLHVSARRCCGPDGADAMLDPDKGTLVSLGDPALFLALGDDLLLVGNEDRSLDPEGRPSGPLTLTLFDLAKGKALTQRLAGTSREAPETGVLAALRLDDGTVLVAHANPPGFVRFDPEARAFSADLAAPLCR